MSRNASDLKHCKYRKLNLRRFRLSCRLNLISSVSVSSIVAGRPPARVRLAWRRRGVRRGSGRVLTMLQPVLSPGPGRCLYAAGRYSSSRSGSAAIWQRERQVMGLTAKVVCNLEPLLTMINQPAENEARSQRPMQRAASVTAEADKWPAGFCCRGRRETGH